MSALKLSALQSEILRFIKAFQFDGLADARVGERPCYWGHEPVPEVVIWAAFFNPPGETRAALFGESAPSLCAVQAALDYLVAVEYLRTEDCTTYPVAEIRRPLDGAPIVLTWDDEAAQYEVKLDGAFVHRHRVINETVVDVRTMADGEGRLVSVRGPYGTSMTEVRGWTDAGGNRESELIVNHRAGRGYAILKTGIQAVDGVPLMEGRTPDSRWEPPAGYVGAKEACSDQRFGKRGKRLPRNTLAYWANRDQVKVVKAPDSQECFYPAEWLHSRICRWNPHLPDRNTRP
ncbi:MAG: hypothetical protein C4547_16010 [Phycisphaerales bacterium]|nr:MAG: hypothetical protein C4547_16010 [Phycisphaerales bacterium]